jgi:periplasmic protein TonB
MRSHESGAGRSTQAAAQKSGWIRSLPPRLVRQAARSAPASLSERLEEEWLADLAAQRGPLAPFRFALGCCWATHVITCEHRAAQAPVATSTTGSKTMTLGSQNDLSLLPQRTSTLVLVVALHIVLIYAFASGLASRVIQLIPQALQTSFIDEPHSSNPPPALPPPSRAAAPIEVVRPDVDVIPPSSETASQPQIQASPATPDPCCAAPRSVTRVQGGPGKGFPNTADYYPPAALRMGQQGAAAVQVCVDEKGWLASEPTLAHSSGIASIDAGALKLASAGSGHYRPSTEDGRPVSACYVFVIRFDLKN